MPRGLCRVIAVKQCVTTCSLAPTWSCAMPVRPPDPRCLRSAVGIAQLVPDAALLLSDPAGVGKTAFAQSLASLFGIRFERIDLSSAAARFTLLGLDAGYGNA